MDRFKQFVDERRSLMNVSPATISWYECSFKWMPSQSPTDDELRSMVMRMRQAGLKATGCNAVIRAVNAYLKWAGLPGHMPKMKEPVFVLPTFTEAQVALLIKWKASGFYERRMRLLTLILLDTGLRITEALNVRVCDVDLTNLLLTVTVGKGRKCRIVPISIELRKAFYQYNEEFKRDVDELVLATKDGDVLNRIVMLRDVKRHCVRLGFKPPARTLHAFRHTFAVNYLRKGGSVFHLQKVLGHSSLEMTRRYANLMTEDLSAVHQKLSLLAA